MTTKKRFLCRIGFHQTFHDTYGENVGTETTPIYILHSRWKCNYCPWSSEA